MNRIEGRVIAGDRLGRRLGFPTANLCVTGPLPPEGVYAALVAVDGRTYAAMVNIGRRPTVTAAGAERVEAHLIGYDGDLYGRMLQLDLVRRIRGERRFDDTEQLSRQLHDDRDRVAQLLKLWF